MNKKDVSIIIGVGALIASAYSVYMLKVQIESQDNLNKRIKRLATCHNNFVKFQEEVHNDVASNFENIKDRMDYIEVETSTNYNSIVGLEKSLNDDCFKKEESVN